MTASYNSAKSIPDALVNPKSLASDAVRCLWVRPIEGRFRPTVVFKDGTDCPLSCAMNELDARRFCQRISAEHDWPVMDHRPKNIGPEVSAEKSWAAIPAAYKTQIAGEACVNMQGIGFMMADMCREYGLPLGVAIHRVTERIASFITTMVAQGAMTDEAGKENTLAATEGAFTRLHEIYAGEDEGPELLGLDPRRLGVALADYHASLSSDDARFLHGLTAALTTALDVWTGEGVPVAKAKADADVAIDSAILHWLRLTGRTVKGGAR